MPARRRRASAAGLRLGAAAVLALSAACVDAFEDATLAAVVVHEGGTAALEDAAAVTWDDPATLRAFERFWSGVGPRLQRSVGRVAALPELTCVLQAEDGRSLRFSVVHGGRLVTRDAAADLTASERAFLARYRVEGAPR